MEKLNQSWDTIMSMNFYDFENILQYYANILEDRRKEEEEDAKRHGYDESKMNPNSMMKEAQKSVQMPKLPSVNIPKF